MISFIFRLNNLIHGYFTAHGWQKKFKIPPRYVSDELIDAQIPSTLEDQLLQTFDMLMEEFASREPTPYEEPSPVSGEIPWRTLHDDRDH